MNLNAVKDQMLVERTLNLVRDERELLTSILHHLREINRRRLFSALGYKSLFDFTVKHLGYPEDQAYRRISAMKLIGEIPEVEERIKTGEISLTHIGLANSLFRQEKKLDKEMSKDQKLSVFEMIASKSVREAERITLSLSSMPELSKPDRVTAVSENLIEMNFRAPASLLTKIETLKGLTAHTHPDITLGELFEKLCELGLVEWTKTAAPRKRCVNKEASKAPSKAQTRRDVYREAGDSCERCESTFALEIDHIVPRAKGGTSNRENLRILCRSCNQRAAIEEFGQGAMDRWLN